VSSSSVLDLPADLHALRLNANSPSLSLTHSTPPALVDHHLPAYDFIADNDMEQLSLEIEKERLGYQLSTFVTNQTIIVFKYVYMYTEFNI